MAGALDGVKILGFTHFAQGPFALQLLGDMGADVINIERQGSGDFIRNFQQLDSLGGEGVFFLAMNRNKRSMSLNLRAPEAKEIVEKLIAQSDVIMTNYRAGALDRMGFGFEAARKINPRIVFCEALGYGSSGPYAALPGQDLLAQALSGLTTMIGPDEDGRPVAGGIYEVDVYGSLMLVIGTLSALYYAKQTGIGQKVSVDLLSSGIHMQSQEIAYFLNSGKVFHDRLFRISRRADKDRLGQNALCIFQLRTDPLLFSGHLLNPGQIKINLLSHQDQVVRQLSELV